jgi:hypothetical protein
MTTPQTRKPRRWSLAQIYHHVLRQSPSPEAAKIAISKARRRRKLHLRGKQREHKARPNLKLKPNEEPRPVDPEITPDCLLPTVQYEYWDWERSRASWREPDTLSLFEYVGIYGLVDEVLEIWPQQPVQQEPKPRKRSGPPATHDWFAICGEIARRCIDPQTRQLAIPGSENKLAEQTLGWYYERTDRRPAESEMRQAVKEIVAALRKV